MTNINSFKAVYCPGLLIRNQATIATLGLLFEKVYLPNDVELIAEFCKSFRIERSIDASIEIESEGIQADPFNNLTKEQKESALNYLSLCVNFSVQNHELFGSVIETNAFGGQTPLDAKLIKKGRDGELNTYEVSVRPMELVSEDDSISKLIENGYFPVAGRLAGKGFNIDPKSVAARELATMLAIKSVDIVFPVAKSVPADLILEAREKLRDHLPPFWSAMFKLSVGMKKSIAECNSIEEINSIGQDIVDMHIRPSLTELNNKIEMERKSWFFRILGDVYRVAKLSATSQSITQADLLKNAMLLGVETAVSYYDHSFKVDGLKNEAGLTYLLEADKVFSR